jgi:AcrR family transcriptional regulator
MMARTKEQNERMKEATKEKILSTAVILFSQKGFSSTSVQDIAKMADISIGLLYHYYKTKDDVYHALMNIAETEIDEIITIFEKNETKKAIKQICKEIIEEFETSYELSQWIAIFPLERLVDTFSKYIPKQQAQFLVATIKGLCNLQLVLKDKFIPPTVEMMTEVIKKGAI